MSVMREFMWTQPGLVRSLLADSDRAASLASERLAGRRILLFGTGTSYHAAQHGAWLLRRAGEQAWAIENQQAALHGPLPGEGDAAILLSHKNVKRYGMAVRDAARASGAPTLFITGQGVGGDLETSELERSAAFTASHIGAMTRLAQLAVGLGASLDLSQIPAAIEEMLGRPGPLVRPPGRLLEFTAAGPNAWTAAEGALKVRETCYIATEGLSMEQLYHGPKVALGDSDHVVALDGGGPGQERLRELVAAYERFGVGLTTIEAAGLGEDLSVFPLTVAVQRIALELAEATGTNPDSFGKDRPGYDAAYGSVGL